MKGQIDLLSSTGPDISEREAFAILRPRLLSVLSDNNIDYKLLAFDRKASYSSITFGSYLIARLAFRGDKSYFSISLNLAKFLPANVSKSVQSKDKKFVRVDVYPASSISGYEDFFAAALQEIIDKLPKDFDCCAWYEECSDAKKCINPNIDLAIGCGYKKILRSGQFFYGKNRNVD